MYCSITTKNKKLTLKKKKVEFPKNFSAQMYNRLIFFMSFVQGKLKFKGNKKTLVAKTNVGGQTIELKKRINYSKNSLGNKKKPEDEKEPDEEEEFFSSEDEQKAFGPELRAKEIRDASESLKELEKKKTYAERAFELVRKQREKERIQRNLSISHK